jgi:hypothetical protein
VRLDKTRIAVRERTFSEILDLALRVTRAYARALLVAFSAGIVPMMLLNAWLLAGYSDLQVQGELEVGFPLRYLALMTLLIIIEAPLATAPATLYLGKALFTERPDVRTVLKELRQSLPQLLVYQVLLRVFSMRWRHLNQVILLERNRMFRRTPDEETTGDRSRALHRNLSGDLAGRGFQGVVAAAALFASVWLSVFLLRLRDRGMVSRLS